MNDFTGDGVGSPGTHWYAVTPNDDNDLPNRPRALYIGGTGDLRLTDMGGTTVSFVSVAVGYHPLRPTRVLATGTTATSIVAIY